MKKTILNLEGVVELKKEQLQKINGGLTIRNLKPLNRFEEYNGGLVFLAG